jgi:hypothetical protein
MTTLVIRLLENSVVVIVKVDLPLEGQLVISVKEIESEPRLRSQVCRGIPTKPNELTVLIDLESVMISTAAERQVDLMAAREVDYSKHGRHLQRSWTRVTMVP